MLKILGYNDVIRNSITGTNHIELLTKSDYRTAWDFNRPIANVYNELESTYKYLEALAKLELGDGVFSGSLSHEFNMTAADVQNCRLNTLPNGSTYVDKNYATLRPGIASVNGTIVVHKPNLRYFERQVAEVLGIFYHNEIEGVWVKYNQANHSFKCKISKSASPGATPTNYYYGCTGEPQWISDATIGIRSLPLITLIYNEVNFNSLFHSKFAGAIEQLQLEPLFNITTTGTKYWNVSNTGVITCDTSVGYFALGNFINTSGVASSISTTHITHAMTGIGSLVRTNSPTIITPIINDIQSNLAADLWSENTTTNITIGVGLTSGTLTIGGISSTGTIFLFPSTVAQSINIGTSTTGTLTIGSTLSTAVQLPTGKTKIGQTNLTQGGVVNVTLPAAAGTLINVVATGNGVSAVNTSGSLAFTLGVITPTTVNGLTFVAATDGFTVAGGTTSRTLTITGASKTINGSGTTLTQNVPTLIIAGTTSLSITGGTNSSLTVPSGSLTLPTAPANIGAIPYYSSTTVQSTIPAVAIGQVLISQGATAAPAWSSSPTITGRFNFAAGIAANASLNIPHGVAPTTPVDGDFWTTTAGLYARINGLTIGPYGAGVSVATEIASAVVHYPIFTPTATTSPGETALVKTASTTRILSYIPSTGQLNSTSFNATSARAMKKNIKPFAGNAIEIINGVNISGFYMIADENSEHYRIGFIADDTHELLATKKHDTMDIGNSIGLLLKAVQELSTENKLMKQEIEILKGLK